MPLRSALLDHDPQRLEAARLAEQGQRPAGGKVATGILVGEMGADGRDHFASAEFTDRAQRTCPQRRIIVRNGISKIVPGKSPRDGAARDANAPEVWFGGVE